MGGRRVQPLQGGRGGVNRRVVDHVLVEELLRGLVAVGVVDIVRRLGRDLGTHDEVDEGMRVVGMRGVGRDRHLVEPHERTLVRCHIVDRSEEHTSELQSLMRISYAVFCLKKKKTITKKYYQTNHTTDRTKQ